MGDNNKNDKSLHIAMYPWFAMGHLKSFLELANKLAQKHIHTSLILPHKTALKLASDNHHPSLITFIPITVPQVEGIPPSVETTADVPFTVEPFLMAAMDMTQETIDSLLTRLKPDIVLCDFANWLPEMARKHGAKSLYSGFYWVSPCIQAFIGCLHSICDNDRYGFICPQISSMVGQSVDEAATYISNWLKAGKKRFIWLRIITNIIEHNQVYWCDPIGNSEIPIFKTVLNTSIRVYGYEGGSRKSSKVPQWIKLDCARQPGKTECGYYIMRYMLEIVTSPNSMCSLDELFQDTTSYSQDEIDEVRDLWADYFLNA